MVGVRADIARVHQADTVTVQRHPTPGTGAVHIAIAADARDQVAITIQDRHAEVRRLRGDGAREARLWVFAGNERARRFYEIDGWRADGARRTEAIGDLAMEEVRYRCALI